VYGWVSLIPLARCQQFVRVSAHWLAQGSSLNARGGVNAKGNLMAGMITDGLKEKPGGNAIAEATTNIRPKGSMLKVVAVAGIVFQLSGCSEKDTTVTVCNADTDFMHFAVLSSAKDDLVDIAIVCGAGGASTSGGHVEIWRISEGSPPTVEMVSRLDNLDNPGFATFGDMDSDGDSDLIVLNRGSGESSIAVFENSAGTFDGATAVLHNYRGSGGEARSLSLHDASSNGAMDLIVPSTDTVLPASVVRNDEAGKMGPFEEAAFYVNGQSVNGTVSDVTGDTISDFVEILAKHGVVVVYVGQSSKIVEYDFGKATRRIESVLVGGDVDGDGIEELLVTVRVDPYTAATHVAVHDGTEWIIGAALPGADNPKFAFVAQMDDDPMAEFVTVSDVDLSEDRYVAHVFDFVSPGQVEASGTIALSTYPSHLVIGDMRGDGKTEIIRGSLENSTLTLSGW
jgi:hypothetical protein